MAIIIKATVVLLLMFLAVRFTRYGRASVRHLLLTAGFGILAILPIGAMVVPAVRVQGIPANVTQYVDDAVLLDNVSMPMTIGLGDPTSDPGEPRQFTILELAFATWLVVALVLLAPVLIGWRQVAQLRRQGIPWLDGQRLIDSIRRDVGLEKASIKVLRHESVPAPATSGFFRHTIFFPVDITTWSREDVVRAAVHEVEHVRRADCVTAIVTRAICSAYWFHPLVWMAWRRLALEAERACDDAVLRDQEPTIYADQLVSIAARLTRTNQHPLLAMANRSDLVERISAVLEPRQARGRAGSVTACLVGLGALIVCLAIAPLQAGADMALAAPVMPPAQTTLPSFEVASVKRNPSGLGRSMIENVQPSGLWHLTNVPTRALIRTAYRVHDFLIVGAPEWVQTEHYDVVARASGDLRPATPGAPRAHFLMLRSLLIDRFKLKARLETRDAPVFALVVARADGKPGAGLVPAHDDCAAIVAAEVKGERPASPPGERPACGMIAGPNSVGGNRIAGGNRSMSELATTLSGSMNRIVLDRTGLSGVFNFTLDFVPDGTPIEAGQNLPSLQAALQEQLGLKLEPARGPVEFLVIDHVERPAEN